MRCSDLPPIWPANAPGIGTVIFETRRDAHVDQEFAAMREPCSQRLAERIAGSHKVIRRDKMHRVPGARIDTKMISHARKWRPLQVAIAWSLTRDDEFCNEIACYENAEKSTFCACNRLEQEMMKAGCFEAVNETIPLDPPSRTVVMIRQKLKSSYVGRFRALAEDYECGGNVI